ncbi:MAG: glutathione synthase [Acidobacteriota bacterium]
MTAHLFVLDPLEALLPDADTSIAFMREAASRGDAVSSVEIDGMSLDSGRPQGVCTELELLDGGKWYRAGETRRRYLDEFDVVWMRKDPPFDQAFYYSTHVLSMIDASTLVVNDPAALRDANEKLFALRFPTCCPESLVSSNQDELLAFRETLGGEMIVKPLDGAGGEGIFHITANDRNAKAILEVSTDHGTRLTLAQRYIPEIRQGDKRIILIEGEPAGAVLRVPLATEARANFHVGGTAQKTELTDREREICAEVGPIVREMGIVFAGIDVIGDWLTEVNVTSPTGIREIAELDGVNLEVQVVDAVAQRLAQRR